MKRLIAAVWFVSSTWLVLFSTGFHAVAQTPPTPPMPGGGIIVGGGFGHGFADDAPDPGDGSDTNGTGAPGYSVPTFTTNDLWLDIAAVTNAEATLTIHYPATNADGIFDLYFTTNLDTNAAPELGMTNWEWLTQLAPGQTNITLTDLTNGPYFFVLTSTNFDQNSNSIPDAWEWQYLGGLYASNTLDFSGSGNTILYDYQNGIDPNIIQFLINTTNAYVNQTNAPLSLAIQGGIPFAYAVSLNTNFSAATWQTYTSSNITASLGTNQGPLTVWVGCRGLPAGTQTWNAICLTLDLTPPSITVTNPATNTLNIPLLQWQGYASEQLSSLTWGLSNALGSISNQPGYITGHSGNTNYFKCFDIGLGMGVNTLTLHAVDLAGNATNVSCNYTLASNTVAPALQIWWPQNGAQVGAGSFTLRGYIPDPTVSLAAQIVDTNNNTNLAVGVIERNGDFWVDNIPLMPGSNSLTLTAVDVWGNTNTTNLIVVQSPVQVTINPVTVARNAASLTVEGTINTSNYEIWVNGVEASVSGGTNWTASNVPANGAGMAVVQACAVTNGGGGSGGGGGTNSSLDDPGNPLSTNSIYAEADIGKQPALICESFNFSSTSVAGELDSNGSEIWTYIQTVNWSAQTGGTMTSNYCFSIYNIYYDPGTFDDYEASQWQWDTNGNGTSQSGYSSDCGVITNWTTPGSYTGATNFGILQGNAVSWYASGSSDDMFIQTNNISANTRYHFLTGDRAVPGLTPLYQFTASANNVYPQFYPVQYVSVAPQNIDVLGGPLDSSGELFTNLPNGEEVDATPIAASAPYYSAGLSFTNYNLSIALNGTNLDPDATTKVIVGQQINLSGSLAGSGGPTISNFSWLVPGTTESQFFVSSDSAWTNGYPIPLSTTNTNTVSFFWVDAGRKTVACTAQLGGVTVTNTASFNVVRPTVAVVNTTGSANIGTESRGVLAIQFGIVTPGFTPGMLFSNNLTVPQGFGSYNTEWVQLITSNPATLTISNSPTNVVVHLYQPTGVVLDSAYPYGNDTPTTTTDSPSLALSLSNEIAASDSQTSEMWLMFQPAGGNWVPLWITTWNCSGSVTGYGPNATNWSFVGTPSISVSASADSGITYPIWTNNATNFPWIPPF